MSWGMGGLHGEAADREASELQELLDKWLQSGLLVRGEIEWDPKEGAHWVRVTTSTDEDHDFTAREFEAFVEGLSAAFNHFQVKGRQG